MIDKIIFILFLIFWIITIGLIVVIAISIPITKRENKIQEEELRKVSRSEADKFVDDFKTKIAVYDGIEKELKKRYDKKQLK